MTAVLLGLTLAALRIFQPEFWIAIFPDDAYYYLRTAQNLARGLGSSFDGINKTNGYHPLWMLALWPLASIFRSPEWLLRAALAVQVLFAAAGFGFLALAFRESGRKMTGFMIAAALTVLNPLLVSTFIDGLESALYFMTLSLTFLLWARISEKPPARSAAWLGIGALLGIVFLSRLDGGLLALWMGIAILISDRPLKSRIKKAAGFGLGFLIIAAPYLIYNLIEFGHPVPISGRVKAFFMSHDPKYLAGVAALFVVVAGSTFILHFVLRRRLSGFAGTLFTYAEFCISAACYYLLSPAFAFAVWYYLPALLVAILVFGWILSSLPEKERKGLVSALAGAGLLFICLGYLVFFFPGAQSFLKTQDEVTVWIKTHTRQDDLLAAWSSGAIAYFSGRQTINLDGLANSPEYFFDYRAKGKRDEFMKKMGVDYIVVYYHFDARPPLDKFSFPVKTALELKTSYRGPGNFFRRSTITYYVLQTPFAEAAE